MDFSKAFDLVPHQRLLLKLKHAGITGSLHKWVTNFLTKRSQQVVLEGVSSSSITVTSGVPQGTVLGPLFFILYLNDLPEGITSQVRLLADDCILYRQISSDEDREKLQADINILCNWESHWQMRFNMLCHARHPQKAPHSVNIFYERKSLRDCQKPHLPGGRVKSQIDLGGPHQQHRFKGKSCPWPSPPKSLQLLRSSQRDRFQNPRQT